MMPPLSGQQGRPPLQTTSKPNMSPIPRPARLGIKRAVSWSRESQVATTINVTELTPDELNATWYGPHDLKSFKHQRRQSAELYDQGIPVDCIRGIEQCTREGSKERCGNIVQGIAAVLDEQEFQDLDGTENPDLLARVAKINTMKSQEEARIRGLQDREEIEALSTMPEIVNKVSEDEER